MKDANRIIVHLQCLSPISTVGQIARGAQEKNTDRSILFSRAGEDWSNDGSGHAGFVLRRESGWSLL
jgi:hypothetical protein